VSLKVALADKQTRKLNKTKLKGLQTHSAIFSIHIKSIKDFPHKHTQLLLIDDAADVIMLLLTVQAARTL